jgi:cysteinyl-tRNA synthetase
VKRWFLLLVCLAIGLACGGLTTEAIGATAYDLVVMDYSADGSDEAAFSAAEIAALQHSPGGEKIVLAYMSIGEAEDYRFYWQEGWRPGDPAWLDEENSDWVGNYKVRYWEPGWQAIVYGSPDSYLDKILAASFDGVYLDIIDAYAYYEERGRETAAREMADFVIALATYARLRRPGFLVFPQNGAELAARFPDYLAAVDGIGQEDVYYGYPDEGDASPPEFVAAIEANLDRFVAAGKPVLAIVYTSDPAQIDDHYARARARGYVPFATVRGLDELTINPGHAPD